MDGKEAPMGRRHVTSEATGAGQRDGAHRWQRRTTGETTLPRRVIAPLLATGLLLAALASAAIG